MHRQNFLWSLVALPAGLFLVSCSSNKSDSGQESTDPAAPPARSGSSTVYTSSISFSHSHKITIDDVTIASAAPFSGTTTNDDNHDHALMVSSDDLAKVAAGQTVQATTVADNSGHTHVFTLLKVA